MRLAPLAEKASSWAELHALFRQKGSEQWKARATRIARENGISFEGWHQGRRPRPGARDKERTLQQAEREGKPAYMDLAFWKTLPEDWQEQEKEQRRHEEERKQELSPDAYARWLAEEQFGPRLRYEFDRSCRRITDHPDDPAAQKAFREAERRMEAFRNGLHRLLAGALEVGACGESFCTGRNVPDK